MSFRQEITTNLDANSSSIFGKKIIIFSKGIVENKSIQNRPKK